MPVQEKLANDTLKRFLLLVAILDRAATSPDLPDGMPLLFRINTKIKASKDVSHSMLADGMIRI